MKSKLRQFALILLVLAICAGAGYFTYTFESTKGLHDPVDGKPADIEHIVTIKPIMVLVYWHSACPACDEQIKVLTLVQMFFDAYFMKTAESVGYVIGINVGDKDGAVKDYWLTADPKFPTLAGGTLPTPGTPTTEIYIEGQLRKRFVGMATYEQIMQIIQAEE